MENTKKGFHPFAYDNEYYMYVKKEEAEKKKFVSLMTQREAEYTTMAEGEYNNMKLSDGQMEWLAFRDNIEPPTPQLQRIDGYDSAEESGGNGESEGGNNSSDDNGGNTETPTDENNGD